MLLTQINDPIVEVFFTIHQVGPILDRSIFRSRIRVPVNVLSRLIVQVQRRNSVPGPFINSVSSSWLISSKFLSIILFYLLLIKRPFERYLSGSHKYLT